jgi:O-antigen/teichoic acid export membrane protein
MRNKSNVKKDFIFNTIGTGINAFNSLFFMIIATRINGVSDAGIFTFAFSTAALFQIIGVYSGRIYQITDNTKATNEDYLVNKVITCVIMFVVSILFILLRGYTGKKMLVILILCIYRTLEAFSEVIYAYFQKNYELYKVGMSLVLKNVLGLIVFLTINIFTRNLIYSTLGLVLNYILIMLSYDFKIFRNNFIKLRNINLNNQKKIFSLGFSTFLLSFLLMYIVNIPRYVIDFKMSDASSSIFGILIMPASVVVLIAQFILHPFLMKINDFLIHKDYKNLKKNVMNICLVTSAFGIFATFIAYLIGIPILEFIYGISLKKYLMALIVVLIGATLYGVVSILSNILVAMRIASKQIIISFVVSIFSLFISICFINSLGVNGACYGYTITMLLDIILYIVLFAITEKKLEKGKIKND